MFHLGAARETQAGDSAKLGKVLLHLLFEEAKGNVAKIDNARRHFWLPATLGLFLRAMIKMEANVEDQRGYGARVTAPRLPGKKLTAVSPFNLGFPLPFLHWLTETDTPCGGSAGIKCKSLHHASASESCLASHSRVAWTLTLILHLALVPWRWTLTRPWP